MGCGEVGSAVARILLQRQTALDGRLARSLRLRHILVRDPNKPRPIDLPGGLLTTDPTDLLTCKETHIVVELMGGVDDARTLILRALAAGKDVVTANKALLATCGAELFAAARTAGRCIAFEASVAGGIPLIDAVRQGLIANEIDAVFGILNGTCNYILTQMLQRKIGYAQALAEAQLLGYAETDPTLDVSGAGSAHKL
ncbi:MAG: homoserine dehydrogenase, partial [bacterium]|nr:homoserine dehydrogenase [bacterium]